MTRCRVNVMLLLLMSALLLSGCQIMQIIPYLIALEEAIRNQDVERVRLIVSIGGNVNLKDEKCQTPLHVAAEVGNIEIAKLLVEAGADVKAKDEDGYTALYGAVQYKHAEVARMLLQAGADMNAIASNGKTPYSLAVDLGILSVLNSHAQPEDQT